jgi:hypothetical protein
MAPVHFHLKYSLSQLKGAPSLSYLWSLDGNELKGEGRIKCRGKSVRFLVDGAFCELWTVAGEGLIAELIVTVSDESRTTRSWTLPIRAPATSIQGNYPYRRRRWELEAWEAMREKSKLPIERVLHRSGSLELEDALRRGLESDVDSMRRNDVAHTRKLK